MMRGPFIQKSRSFHLVSGSPRLGSPTETYAHVIISHNDNSSGVLVLSSSQKNVSEGQTSPVLEVIRQAGAFGAVSEI